MVNLSSYQRQTILWTGLRGTLQKRHDISPILITALVPDVDHAPDLTAKVLLADGLLVDKDHARMRLVCSRACPEQRPDASYIVGNKREPLRVSRLQDHLVWCCPIFAPLPMTQADNYGAETPVGYGRRNLRLDMDVEE